MDQTLPQVLCGLLSLLSDQISPEINCVMRSLTHPHGTTRPKKWMQMIFC